MKNKHLALSILLVLIIGLGAMKFSTPSIITNRPIHRSYHEAGTVWSDNFTDGDMDGWTTFAWPDSELPANFTIIDGIVYAQDEERMNIAAHESAETEGTWSFDILIGSDKAAGVEFISSGSLVESDERGYELIFSTAPTNGISGPSIQLVKLSVNSASQFVYKVLDHYNMNPLGWHHVDITRDRKGYICVYFNNTLILDAVDESITSSNQFSFAFQGDSGGAFDNVVVSNSVDIDLVGPRFVEEPTDQNITEGEAFSYRINATDVNYVDGNSWSVNDTVNFAISTYGKITNATELVAGVYGLEVSVSDGIGNTRSATFRVTVEDSLSVVDPLLFIVGGGAIVVVVIIALIVFMKKRA